MPYLTNPKCVICHTVHPKDTHDVIQLQKPDEDYKTVFACKTHSGVLEEKERQEAPEFASKVVASESFAETVRAYHASLSADMRERIEEADFWPDEWKGDDLI